MTRRLPDRSAAPDRRSSARLGARRWPTALLLTALACSEQAVEPKGPPCSGASASDCVAGSGGGGGSGGSPAPASVGLGETGTSLSTSWQALHAVAARPDEVLAIFADARAGEPHAYAARVSADGTVRDPRGVALGPATAAVAESTPEGYVAAWLECRDVAGPCTLRVAGLQDDGGALRVTARTLQQGVSAIGLSLLRVGPSLLLLWHGAAAAPGGAGGQGGGKPTSSSPTVYVARLDDRGQTSQEPTVIAGLDAMLVTAAGSPTGALLVTSTPGPSGPTLATRRLLPTLELSAAQALPPLPGVGLPRLAYGGSTFLFVSGTFEAALRFTEGGDLLDDAPIPLAPLDSSGWFASGLSFAHGAFHASRRLGTSFRQWSISPSGVVTAETVPDPWTGQRLWLDQGERWSILSTSTSGRAGFAVGQPAPDAAMTPLTTHAISQRAPALATGGGASVAAWTEAVDDEIRVQVAGGPALAQGKPAFQHLLDTMPSAVGPVTPAVAAGPAGSVVAWVDARREPLVSTLKAVRFAPDGARLDAAPLVLAEAQATSSDGGFPGDSVALAAASPSGWSLVRRFAWGNATGMDHICLLDLPATGPPTPVSRGCLPGYASALSAVDGGHVVAWTAYDTEGYVTAVRVDHGAQLASPAPSGSGGATSGLPRLASGFGRGLATASDGRTVLVTWFSEVQADTGWEFRPFAMLLDAATLKVLRPSFKLAEDVAVERLAAVFDGERYRVAWRDGASGGVIRALRLDASGQIVGAAETLAQPGRAWPGLALATAPEGLLVAHTPLSDALGSPRLELRTHQR